MTPIDPELKSLIDDVLLQPTLEKFQALLRRGVDINSIKRADGQTLLMRAMIRWPVDARLLATLLERGADPDAQSLRGHCALLMAVASLSIKWVELLLNAGANPNIQDQQGTSPLIMAVRRESVPLVKRLLAAGATPNLADRMGRSSLHHAAERDGVEILFLLLDHGANIEAMDGKGQTPLGRATLGQARNAAGALRLRGANRAFDHGGEDPYAAAFAASKNALAHGWPGIFFHDGGHRGLPFMDETIGLPVLPINEFSTRLTLCQIGGHNDGLRESLRRQELPWNCRRPWLDDILHARERRAHFQPGVLRVGAPPEPSPDGTTTLELLPPAFPGLPSHPLMLRSPRLWPEYPPRAIEDFKKFERDPGPPGRPRPEPDHFWSAEPRCRDVFHWGGRRPCGLGGGAVGCGRIGTGVFPSTAVAASRLPSPAPGSGPGFAIGPVAIRRIRRGLGSAHEAAVVIRWRRASCRPWSRGFQPGGGAWRRPPAWEWAPGGPGGWKRALHGNQDGRCHMARPGRRWDAQWTRPRRFFRCQSIGGL